MEVLAAFVVALDLAYADTLTRFGGYITQPSDIRVMNRCLGTVYFPRVVFYWRGHLP